MNQIELGLLRSMAFYMAEEYPSTYHEWIAQAEISPNIELERVEAVAKQLMQEEKVKKIRGRIILPGYEACVTEHETRRDFFHGKIRKAKKVARYLAHQKNIRFVALCNTTALAHARQNADLDFFVITRANTIWQTRMISVTPYKILGKRPKDNEMIKDAVCLSFFVDERALSLEKLQLIKNNKTHDPYLRYWFLSLLPLYNDGILRDFWNANRALIQRHGLAKPWIMHPDVAIRKPIFRLPRISVLELLTKNMQKRNFPIELKKMANQDTRVIIHDKVLKFHLTDRRAHFRDVYERICEKLYIEP